VEIQEVEPAPKLNQLVVDVAYAGVVFPDVLQMPGEYQLRPELPFTPGWEVSGVVRVDAGGFRAEYVAQPAGGDQHQCEPQGCSRPRPTAGRRNPPTLRPDGGYREPGHRRDRHQY
jgi:NADPH:quinone reductase-like Zn-dependent oxidoreductase